MVYVIACSKYDSLEALPMYNWDKINKTSDLGWLLKRHVKVTESNAVLNKLYVKLYDDLLSREGVGKLYMDIIDLENERYYYQGLYLKGQKSLLAKIEILTSEIEEMKAGQTESDLATLTIGLSKYAGFLIRTKKISVVEFYALIKAANGNK
jgi:hypothetical protein